MGGGEEGGWWGGGVNVLCTYSLSLTLEDVLTQVNTYKWYWYEVQKDCTSQASFELRYYVMYYELLLWCALNSKMSYVTCATIIGLEND